MPTARRTTSRDGWTSIGCERISSSDALASVIVISPRHRSWVKAAATSDQSKVGAWRAYGLRSPRRPVRAALTAALASMTRGSVSSSRDPDCPDDVRYRSAIWHALPGLRDRELLVLDHRIEVALLDDVLGSHFVGGQFPLSDPATDGLRVL